MPIAPPPEQPYAPLPQEKKAYDQLIIPPPMPVDDANTEYPHDPIDRIHSATDIKPNMGGPDF